jgi:hypothetical protein
MFDSSNDSEKFIVFAGVLKTGRFKMRSKPVTGAIIVQ